MSTQPPAQRESETPSGDDRRVAQFLARARPIIAAHRGLTPGCRRQLTDVGRGLGLDDRQMADALLSLTGNPPAKTAGKPPPLPKRAAEAAEPSATVSKPATPRTPIAPLKSKPPKKSPQTAAAEEPDRPGGRPGDLSEPAEAPSPAEASSTTSPPPPPGPAPPPPGPSSPTAESAAPPPPEPPQPPEPLPPTDQAAPPPPPPPPAPPEPPPPPGPKPCEAFTAELRKAFAKVGREGALSEKAETKLAISGKNSFQLSEIYARHLVYEVAAECGLPVVSQIRRERLQKASDEDDRRDATFREFLDRVTPIIAEQRGINVRSRVKMGAVARELGLSDDDVEQALKSLQKAETPEQAVQWLTEREQVYREKLAQRLAKRAGSVLTFAKEKELVQTGVDRYGVSEAFVREALRPLMAEHNIRYVSEKQARDHVARLVDERIGASQRIAPPDRKRLHLEGTQWGLLPTDVDDIIREKHVEIGEVARSRQTRSVALLAACAMLVVAAAGGLAVLLLYRSLTPPVNEPTQTVQQPAGTNVPETPAPTDVERKPRLPEWWDGPLTNYIVQASISSPNCSDTLKKIRSEDPQVRGRAYAQLVRQAPDPQSESAGAADAQHILRLAHLEGVLTGCYALDPDDTAAESLRTALLDCVPPAHSELPSNAVEFRKAFWAVRVALASLNHEKITSQRAAELSRAIGHAVGTRLEKSDDPSEAYLAGLEALCGHLYRLLIAAAPAQPSLVLGLHAALAMEAARYLDAAKRLTFDTDLLVAALPAVGNTWQDWEKLILRCISSRDPANVLRVVDVFETLDNRPLQEFLRQPLLIRSGVRDAATVEELANRVRRALGGSERTGPRTAAQRLAAFEQKAEKALENLEAGPEQPDRLLTEVIRLQHASTLGCALAQQELGVATFDEINGREPESLVSSRIAAEAPRIRPSPRARREAEEEKTLNRLLQRQMQTQVATLRNIRTSASHRNVAARWLATQADLVPEIDPQLGDAIGEYLLLPKTVPEHNQIAPYVKALCRWRSVRLGLARHIEDSKLRPEHQQQILATALGREVTYPENDELWPAKMRRALLRSVADELAGAAVPVASAPAVYDRASNLLHDYYSIQARLQGVLPGKYMTTETPAAVLELLIGQAAADLSGQVTRPADQQLIREISHQLDAAKYVGTDHLAETVLFERIWLRLLAARVAADHPDRAAAADELVAQLGRRDAAAQHILTQLRDGHETTLRMWQLMCEP